jgi:hypothetical protein
MIKTLPYHNVNLKSEGRQRRPIRLYLGSSHSWCCRMVWLCVMEKSLELC